MEELKNIQWPGWEISGLIGNGSYGAVYEIQRNLYGNVEKAALKVIRIPQSQSDIDELYNDGFDDESITERFSGYLEDIVREYSLMASLKGNKNVVYCDDIRQVQHEDGMGWDIYIKMELLTPLVKTLGKEISEAQVIDIGIDMCNALILCRERNIVHRDIKPQNIFVSRDGVYKLGDFGIAKTAERTTSGTKTGTYKYMAPEVYKSEPYGTAADQYSLGMVLYWLLNERRTPFLPLPSVAKATTVTMEDAARKRRFDGEELPPPAHGSDQLQAVVLKACAYDPKQRFASAAEMLEALRALKNGGALAVDAVPAAENAAVAAGVLPDGVLNQQSFGWQSGTKTRVSSEQQENVQSPPARVVHPSKDEREKKRRIGAWSAIAVAFLIFGCVLLLIFGRNMDEGFNNSAGIALDNPLTITEPDGTLPVQLDWAEWTDTLPPYVTNNDYEVEERTLYRSRSLETTSSTASNKMDGWELYDTATGSGDYGAWSDWGETAVFASDTRDVATQTRYRYSDKETTTGRSSSMSGWTLDNTTYSWGDYGAWSDWSATAVSNSDSRQVETQNRYRYRDKETTASTSGSMSGWTQYNSSSSWGEWGNWSDWSTGSVSGNDSRQVDTKTQYRYRDISYTTQYTSWGSWSGWQDGYVGSDNYTDVETRTVYRYYYYTCTNCGFHWHGYGETCHTWAGGCGAATVPNNWDCVWETVPYSSAADWHGTSTYYINSGSAGRVFCYKSGEHYVEPKTQYRYRTRSTYQEANYGSWSSWGDTYYSGSSTRDVESRTMFRSRTRNQTTTYYYYRWSNWSSWSTSAVSGNDSREVQSTTYYRYRDRSSVPTYHFSRWKDWSAWSETVYEQSNTRKVERATFYRFRDRVAQTTYYFQRWTDWSDYSESPVDANETVEVETKTQYRYKSKET